MSGTSSTKDFLEAFKKDLKKAPARRKSDEILSFIRKNWKMFGVTRQSMEMLVKELEQRGCLTATALADELGLPENVLFKRAKVAETAKMLLRPLASPLIKLFDKQVEQRAQSEKDSNQLCIVIVAGESSMVITNMSTRSRVPGKVYVTLMRDSPEQDIELFKVEDVPERMPEVFNRGGVY